jgi:hypothetical protein
MQKQAIPSRILAIVGLTLVWLPILAPLVFAVIRLAQSRHFMFDYLMPAEVFPVVLLGGGLLLWAAWRARSYRKLIGWSLGLMVGFLLAAVGLAEVTGIASGATEAAGLAWALVLAAFAGFWIALLALAGGGILILRGSPVNPLPASGK